MFLALAGGFLTTAQPGKPYYFLIIVKGGCSLVVVGGVQVRHGCWTYLAKHDGFCQGKGLTDLLPYNAQALPKAQKRRRRRRRKRWQLW